MAKLQRKFKSKDAIIFTIIILLIIINLVIIAKYIVVPKGNNEIEPKQLNSVNNTKDVGSEVPVYRTDDEIVKYLSTLGEKSRMEYYCGKYIKSIKDKDYETAYNMLYTEFKQKYFPTFEEYELYIKQRYPQFFSVKYDDLSRQGNLYVLRLIIMDSDKSLESGSEDIQRIVIKENDFNDYVISFQVN